MDLLDTVVGLADEGGGTYGVAARNLSTGDTINLRADEEFDTASVVKVPIMVELFHQAHVSSLHLQDRMATSEEFVVGGAGILKDFALGLQPTLRDLCVAMIALSDNTATNMLAVGVGIEAVNERMHSLGLRRTRLNRLVSFRPPSDGRTTGLGATTPNEMLRLFELLAAGEAVSPEMDREMTGILALQHDRSMVPRYLPDGYDSVTGKGDPEIAAKTGAVSRVRNDVSLLTFSDGRRWIISAFSKDLQDRSNRFEHTGEVTIGRIARAIWDAWS